MSAGPYRVIQWATGNTGQRALREVIRDPSLELVAVRVYDEAKHGVDAGELCGEDATGVLATTDRDAVLAVDADCCIYTPRATGHGPSRAGLSEDDLVADAVALLESGTNIVTTCADFFHGARRLGDDHRSRLLAACETGGTSVWPSGSDPGFITETLPMALLSVQRNVDLIEIQEFGDVSQRPSRHMVMEQMKFGKQLSEIDPTGRINHLFYEYLPTLKVLADIADIEIDEWLPDGGIAVARDDLQIVAGEIKKGTAAAHKVVFTGRAGGVDRIRFIQYGYVTRDVEPDWGLQPTGWHIRIESDAPFDISLPFPVPLDELADHVPAYNANGPVNAIPYVIAAPPGILTTVDLPHILPRAEPVAGERLNGTSDRRGPSVITGPEVEDPGPHTHTVLDYVQTLARLAGTVEHPHDWEPLTEFIAPDRFERVGVFREVQDWSQYTEMMTGWASAIDRFESTVHRVAEVNGLVYYEVEERHFRGEDTHVVDSMTVFGFDDDGKICHLDVYLQQTP